MHSPPSLSAVCAGMLLMVAAANANARVSPGVEVFMAQHLGLIKGKRVGLITNQTGVDSQGRATIDLLKNAPGVNLVALFAPEHGIRGDVKAGEHFPGGKDPKTGLPIYSLYGGKDHRPPKEALEQIDVLVYDIQDVGSRAYTFVWHMAECMRSIAESGKEMIVLDRPNPLGAIVLDGPITEPKFISFIGLFPVPRVYGMTVGELGWYLNVEEGIKAKLTIIPMAGYQRGMSWKETGLRWTPPSPNIPSPDAACCFAATGTIGETGSLNIGCGDPLSFQVFAASWLNPELTAGALNSLKLPGVTFQPIMFKPVKGGYSKNGVAAVQFVLTDPATFKPTTTEVAILCHLQKTYPSNFSWMPDRDRKRLVTFDKAMGTSTVRVSIVKGEDYRTIAQRWETGLRQFDAKRQKYLIYK